MIKRVEIMNFCRFYGKHEVSLKPGITFVTSKNLDEPDQWESNGVGKTALIHAISYALFGSTPNGLQGKELISHVCGAKDFMRIEVEIGDCVLTRSYYPSRQRSEVTLQHPSGKFEGDVSVVNRNIQDYFSVTPQLFNSALFLSQRDSTSTQFLAAKPAQRSKILSDLVDDRVWQKAGEYLSVDAKESEAEVTSLSARIQVQQRNLDNAKVSMASLQEQLATVARVEEERRDKLKERLSVLRAEIDKESAIERDAPVVNAKELEASRMQLAKRLHTLEDSLKEHPLPAPPMSMGVTCPTCQSVVQAEVVEKVIAKRAEVIKERDRLTSEIREVRRELEAIAEKQARAKEWAHRVALAADRRERYKTEAAHIADQLQAPRVSMVALAEQEAEAKRRVKDLEEDLQKSQERMLVAASKAQKMKQLALGFKSEIRNLLFDRIRGELENFTRAYLYNLAGKGIWVEYPSGGSGREKFDILVYNGDQVQSLEAFSGGEFWRATLAILFALRDVLVLKSKCKLPILFVDDPVGPVDPIGLTNLFITLQGLVDCGSASTILVTVPDDGVATTGNLLRLERKDGLSRFI